MFPTLYGTYFPLEMHFKMSSAICFSLEQSKILSSGNGLTWQFSRSLHSLKLSNFNLSSINTLSLDCIDQDQTAKIGQYGH